jgi:DNA-binding CsgD family transcriptional regulator
MRAEDRGIYCTNGYFVPHDAEGILGTRPSVVTRTCVAYPKSYEDLVADSGTGGACELEQGESGSTSGGLVLADGSSRVIQINRFAQEIFAAQDGFGVRNSVLTAKRHDDSMAIRAAVAKVVAHRGDSGKTLLVARDHGRRPYVVLISPVSLAASAFFGQSRRLALLLIGDPERRPKSLDRHLIDTFRLSQKEAELAAAVFEGKRFSDIAEERGISLNTIKTQMKAIFLKTETTRQSELVRLLGSIPGI